jgi:uncharacterized LabA/DUF88 family protein
MGNKNLIIVDGSNFYHRLKGLGLRNVMEFNYQKLQQLLVNEDEEILCKYYIGAIRENPSSERVQYMFKKQRQLFNRLENIDWTLRLGHLLKTDRYREKGVDVLMAIDMVTGACEEEYDEVILISSDTDLIPAIQKVQSMGKKVRYVGFKGKPSYALIRNCDSHRLLTRDQLLPFLPNQDIERFRGGIKKRITDLIHLAIKKLCLL